MHKQLAVIIAAIVLTAGMISPAHAQTVTIAALGDSLTQGYGLPQGVGLVPQLQNWLASKGADVALINAGVSGDTTTGGLARVDWTLTPDVDAIIVTLGGNDMLRGIAPELTARNLDQILTITQERKLPTLLIGLTAPLNFGSDYKSEFDALYSELAQKHGVLFVEDLFSPLLALGTWQETLATHMQTDGIHPNAQGVTVIVNAIGPKVLELAQMVSGAKP